MTTTFYDILTVPPEADEALLRHAYEHALSALAKRLRTARQRSLDTGPLEDERQALEEAWRVLSDPPRRARYDRFLQLAEGRGTMEADELWARVQSAMLDPAAGATLDLTHLLTRLDVGDPRPPAPAPAPPPPLPAAPLAPPPAPAPPPAMSAPVAAAPATPPRPAAAAPHPLVTAQRPAPVATLRPTPAPSAPTNVIELPPPTAPRADDPQTLVYELGYSGALLRRLREAKGISLDDLAASTRIARRYLEAIEADDFAALPAATFVRGYLRSVAKCLEVDPERLASGYMARMGR